MELLGFLIAALALIIGIWHVVGIHKVLGETKSQRDAAIKHTKELHTHTVELQHIKESLSTRYIGLFPEYYPEIAKLVESAEKEIVILCDFPGYGSFTDRVSWLNYKQALERRSQVSQVSIDLTCFEQQLRKKIVKSQLFSDEESWDDWKNQASNRRRLEGLLKFHSKEGPIEGLSKERLLEILEAEEQEALQGPFVNASLTEINVATQLYFWLIDRKRAIFAIASLGEKEYGFSTTDQKLIDAFLEMKERHLKETRLPEFIEHLSETETKIEQVKGSTQHIPEVAAEDKEA